MSRVSSETRSLAGTEYISESVDKLRAEMKKATPYWGYLLSTLGNENQRKLEDSFSGHAVSAMTPANGMLAILSICRCWEKDSGQKFERPLQALFKIKILVPDIEKIRLSENPEWDHPNLQIGTLADDVDQTISLCEDFLNSPVFGQIRTFRTEYLAHSTAGRSRDRKRFKLQDIEVNPEYNEVVDALGITSKIVDKIISHWDFHIEKGYERAEIYSGYVDNFWDSLPIFREIEDDSSI